MAENIPYSGGGRATKDGRAFKGCCKVCKQPIYSGHDHDDGCIYDQ